MKDRQVKITMRLFNIMVSYIYDHYDELDCVRFEEIYSGINKKIDDCLRRTARSIANPQLSPAERELARRRYGDMVCATEIYRWPESWAASTSPELIPEGKGDPDA